MQVSCTRYMAKEVGSILYPPADIFGVGDGNVNFLDFSVQGEDWGEGTP